MQINNNLNTFRVLFLVKGILNLCFSLFFIFYLGIALALSTSTNYLNTNNDFPFNLPGVFVVIGCTGLILSISLGILTLLASQYIKALKHYNFIFVVAIINCFTGILGILLGVFCLIELNKPEVKKRFNIL